MNKKLLFVLFFQAFLLLSVIRPNAMLWWDECTQLLLAKTALQNPLQFHDYNVGGWHVESGKAHLFPWLLAILGADQQAGIILNAILSLVVSVLLFKIAEMEFGDTAAFLSVLIMLSFADPFLLYAVKLYNHMLAIALSLLSVYLMQRRMVASSALAFGFSAISRYDTWLTALPIAYLLVKKNAREWKKLLMAFLLIALAVASLQFIVSDISEFGRPFASFAYERSVFLGMAPSIEPLYYFTRFLLGNPIAAILLPLGIFLSLKNGKNTFLIWLISSLLFFEVLTPFKHLRFLLSMLPVFSALAAYGFTSIGEKTGRRAMLVILVLFSSYNIYLSASQMDFVKSALRDDLWIRDVSDFIGDNKTVITNYFSPLACHSGSKILVLPPDKSRFQEEHFDYLLVLSGSYRPEYLQDVIVELEKVDYTKKSANATNYEYGTLDLYVRTRPSASP